MYGGILYGDIGIPPTRTRPVYEAYLRGEVKGPWAWTGKNFWESSQDEFDVAYAAFHNEFEKGEIYNKLTTVEGNLDTAARSLAAIAKQFYGTTKLTGDQWGWVVAQHDKGGRFGEAGCRKDGTSAKLGTHNTFENFHDSPKWKEVYDKSIWIVK